MNKIISICYLVMLVITFVQLMLLKKNNEKENFVKWFIINIFIEMSVISMIGAVLYFFPIKVSLISVSLNLVLVNILLGLYLFKNKKIQKYELKFYDILFLVVVIILVFLCGIKQFGNSLSVLNFETSDPSIHLTNAMNVTINGKVGTMFLNSINSGLLFEASRAFLNKYISIYRVYILWEMFLLFLAGSSLYVVICKYMQNISSKVFSIIVLVYFLTAYPFNSMIFGFGYLSLGVSVIAICIELINMYTKEKINKKTGMILISIIMFAVMLAYIMFAPVTYAAVFFTLLIYYLKKKTNVKAIIIELFIMQGIPGIICSFFMLIMTFANRSPSTLLSLPGYSYNDLYGNLLVYFPMVIALIIFGIRRKSFGIMQFMIIFQLVFTIGMYFFVLNSKVSPYYYSKNYYLLAMLLAGGTIIFFSKLTKTNIDMAISTIIVSLIIFGLFFSNVEQKLMDKSLAYNNRTVSSVFFNIYNFNIDRAETDGYSQADLQLYDWVNANISENEKVAIAANTLSSFWYNALTRQRMSEYAYYSLCRTGENYIKKIKETDYIVVVINSEPYENNKEYFDGLEKIYQNQSGFIAIVK